MTLKHLRDQRLFLRDRLVHYRRSFLLCNIPQDTLDDFVLYLENINLLIGGWKTWRIGAASNNLHDVIPIVDNLACLQVIVAPEMGACTVSRCCEIEKHALWITAFQP